MLKLTVMVGLPASGKTTLSHDIAAKEGGIVLSSDAVRAELYGDESIQGNPATVFEHLHRKVFAALDAGINVIYDATNINSKKRMAFLRGIRAKYKEIHCACVVVLCPPNELIVRDLARERTVGEKVINKMFLSFQAPDIYEGWDNIVYEWTSVPMDMDELFENARSFDQKNHHHSLPLFDHMAKAADLVYDTSVVECAAWYHDIGKMFCQTFDEKGEAHYYNHNNASCYIYLCSDRAHARYYDDYYPHSVSYISSLICWHMVPYQFKKKEEFFYWAGKRGMGDRFANDLWELHQADVEAH